MSTLLMVIAGYLVLDLLATTGMTGRTLEITPGVAAVTTLTRAFMVIVLLVAALGGVTP